MSELKLVCWACVLLSNNLSHASFTVTTIVFTTAMTGIFLLNGASSSTALGLLSLMYAMSSVAFLVDDVPEKFGFDSSGILINSALYSGIAFGNLLNQEWATLANNVGAVWALLNAAFILTGKFKEVSAISNQC